MSIVRKTLDRILGRKPVVIIEPKPRIVALQTITEEKLEEIKQRKEYDSGEIYRRTYENDGLTFQLVNYLANKIVSNLFFEGDRDLVDKAQKWSETVGLEFLLKMLVKDILIYGTAWIEMVPDEKMNTIEYFKVFNPTEITFKKTSQDKIEMDGNRPKGFVIEENGHKIEWYKDKILENGKEVYKAKIGEDLRDRIAWFVLEKYGDSLEGNSFIKPVYRSIIIRSNIADLVGESAFRGGGIVAYFTGTPPQQIIDSMSRDLQNITSKNIFVISDKWKLDTVPIPDIKERIEQIKFLADEEAASFGVPIDILMSTVQYRATDLATKMSDFEQRIMSYQRYLAFQINNSIIRYLLKLWKREKGNLYLRFTTSSVTTRLENARIRSMLARRNLLKWDPELELRIRHEENLPTRFVKEELEKWEQQHKTIEETKQSPEVDKEIDTQNE